MNNDSKFIFPLIVFLLSAALHLLDLDKPHSVVFDEVHFGKYLNSYCHDGKRFFDIHPPHGALLVAASAKLAGYDGSFDFKEIGKNYGKAPVFAFRLVPAISGILLNMIFYILLLQFGTSRATAFLGALFLTLDNALLVQTRIIAIDGILLAAIFGSLSLSFAAKAASTAKQNLMLLLLCGCSAGLAVGTKFTGLTALALSLGMALISIIRSRTRKIFVREVIGFILIIFGAVVVYLIGWYLHFVLLPADGPGDAFYKPQGKFFIDFFNLHSIMLNANYFLDKTHQYASQWWSWPVMGRPIFYWSGSSAGIYFLGNPIVWWGGTFAFILAVFCILCKSAQEKNADPKESRFLLLVPMGGFLISYLPHIFIPRILFMYHYLPPLVFSLWFAFPNLEKNRWIKEGGLKKQNWFFWISLTFLLAGFLFISPLTFGWQYHGWYENLVFGFFRR